MKNLFQYLADNKEPVPPMLILELREQLDHYNQLNSWIKDQKKKLENLLKDDELLTLLQSVPGIGQ